MKEKIKKRSAATWLNVQTGLVEVLGEIRAAKRKLLNVFQLWREMAGEAQHKTGLAYTLMGTADVRKEVIVFLNNEDTSHTCKQTTADCCF